MIMEYGIIANTGLDNVNAATLKDFVIIILAIGGFAMAAFTTFRPQKPTVITPDPLRIEKLDKFATRDFCEMKHLEVNRRLDTHDEQLAQLRIEAKAELQQNQEHASARSAAIYRKVDEVREELTAKMDGLNEQMTTGFKDVERAVGRIEGQIKS